MATPLSTILTAVRVNLQETTAKLWTDAEIVVHFNACIKDLWRALNTQYQDFFFATSTAVTYVASAETLSNVPAGVSTILGLELADPTAYPNLIFVYKNYNSEEFISARASADQDPANGGRIYFCATGAGAPTAAPTIYIAPQLSAALSLRLSYIPVVGTLVAANDNPVPGESDRALECYATGYARAKIRESGAPDPEWLALYATEKQNILVAVTPRQEVTDQVAESVFGEY